MMSKIVEIEDCRVRGEEVVGKHDFFFNFQLSTSEQ